MLWLFLYARVILERKTKLKMPAGAVVGKPVWARPFKIVRNSGFSLLTFFSTALCHVIEALLVLRRRFFWLNWQRRGICGENFQLKVGSNPLIPSQSLKTRHQLIRIATLCQKSARRSDFLKFFFRDETLPAFALLFFLRRICVGDRIPVVTKLRKLFAKN